MAAVKFGVYPHVDPAGQPTGRGFVVRSMNGELPYARLPVVRAYEARALAHRFADKLTLGQQVVTNPSGFLGRISAPHVRAAREAYRHYIQSLAEDQQWPLDDLLKKENGR